jgi:hypothetical protein
MKSGMPRVKSLARRMSPKRTRGLEERSCFDNFKMHLYKR